MRSKGLPVGTEEKNGFNETILLHLRKCYIIDHAVVWEKTSWSETDADSTVKPGNAIGK